MIIAPTASPAVSSQLIETALRAAAGVTGMQLVFVSAIDAQTFTWRALHGTLDGIAAGTSLPLEQTFCSRLLAGAPSATADAALDPAYADVPLRDALSISSYVGVPLRQGGVVTGTLGAFDSGVTPVAAADVSVLAALARMVTAEASRDPEVRLRRTATGWEVEDAGGHGVAGRRPDGRDEPCRPDRRRDRRPGAAAAPSPTRRGPVRGRPAPACRSASSSTR